MEKEGVAHIYNGILLTARKRNETEVIVVRWMDPESVIQSEEIGRASCRERV